MQNYAFNVPLTFFFPNCAETELQNLKINAFIKQRKKNEMQFAIEIICSMYPFLQKVLNLSLFFFKIRETLALFQ